jgi:hypothetical protein
VQCKGFVPTARENGMLIATRPQKASLHLMWAPVLALMPPFWPSQCVSPTRARLPTL